MERSKKSNHRLIYRRKSGWPAPSSPNTTRTSVVMTSSKREGVGIGLWWRVSLAVTWWSGCSRWAWLRIRGRRSSTGSAYRRAGCSSTSGRNTASKTVTFITASWHKKQGQPFCSVFIKGKLHFHWGRKCLLQPFPMLFCSAQHPCRVLEQTTPERDDGCVQKGNRLETLKLSKARSSYCAELVLKVLTINVLFM